MCCDAVAQTVDIIIIFLLLSIIVMMVIVIIIAMVLITVYGEIKIFVTK